MKVRYPALPVSPVGQAVSRLEGMLRGLLLSSHPKHSDGVYPSHPSTQIGSRNDWEIHAPDDRRDGTIAREDRRLERQNRNISPGTSEQTQDFAISTPRDGDFG